MRSIGSAERALNLMLERVSDPNRKTFGKMLKDHGTIIADIARSRSEIDSARLLVLTAALRIDIARAKGAMKDIGIAKVSKRVSHVSLRLPEERSTDGRVRLCVAVCGSQHGAQGRRSIYASLRSRRDLSRSTVGATLGWTEDASLCRCEKSTWTHLLVNPTCADLYVIVLFRARTRCTCYRSEGPS
jgi:hypothetical protein